jgi:DNA-directed RNA polymerase beta subunit
MTIGKLLEMLHGALGVTQGEIQDATPFFNVSARWALEQLMKEGYNDTYTMISGTTGEVYAQPWFLGVCFYQRLKHHVLDKVAARARGVLAVLTRQPVDGRANNGGQKFGEMEFDALKAAGAAHVSLLSAHFPLLRYKWTWISIPRPQKTIRERPPSSSSCPAT